MHLHSLKVKNLASLRGEHEVNFETLAGQDLFAITGETGAGKSTILNALALALYGRVYKRQLVQSDLVTLGEREASIALHFSVRSRRYLATWQTVVRKKDGTPLSTPRTERFFYELPADGDEKEARVQACAPEEVLQLDFEQFCKCVVLNQGEFARFLTAGFAERRDILERLYPSDNIDTVGGIARRRHDQHEHKVHGLEERAHALEGETLFDVEAVRAEEQRCALEQGQSESLLAQLRPRAVVLSDLMGKARMHADERQALTRARQILEERTRATNEATAKWGQAHAAWQLASEQWARERTALEADAKEEQELLLRSRHEEADGKQVQQRRSQLAQLTLRVQEAQSKVAQARAETERLRTQRFPAECDWGALDLARVREWEREEGPLLERLKALAERLEQAKNDGRTLKDKVDALRASRDALVLKLPLPWRPLAAAARVEALKAARMQEAELRSRRDALAKLADAEARLESLRPREAQARQKLSEHAMWGALQGLRQHLVAAHGEDCPVCRRPVDEALWDQLITRWSEDAAQAQQQTLERERREAEECLKRVATVENECELWRRQLPKETPSAAAEILDLDAAETHHWELARADQALAEAEQRVAQERERWKAEQEKLQRAGEEHTRWKTTLDAWLLAARGILGVPLEWEGAQLRELHADAETAQRLVEKRRELALWETQAQQRGDEQAALTAELAASQARLDEALAQTEKRRSALRARHPQGAAERLRQRQDELHSLEKNDHLLHNESKLAENKLADARARVGEIEDQLKKVELLCAREAAQLDGFHVGIEEALPLLGPMGQEALARVQAAEEALKAHTERRSALQERLKQDQQLREKRALLQEEQTRLRAELQRMRRLMDVLGQDDLRTYVLSLVEAALIAQTNRELQKLCGGRYEIQHNARKGRLAPEFWVIDRWRDGMIRKVTTLSGGETFMVSLAMALALAEMARGRADIDSFFIDEGFGTLDEDSLDGVLDMLQQVRSRGKQIGLITHVKALSARLPVNLHLQKDARGNSAVSVVWN